jgi:thymidylate synthase
MRIVTSPTLDGLFLEGAGIIIREGRKINTHAGEALQVVNVVYVLTNSRNRVFLLRNPTSTRYMCRELLAYFRGSLNVEDGLAQASRAWRSLADANGLIWSNYGYYVFYERIHGKTQYEWVLETLIANIDSRRALININQIYHKDLTTKDFPCNIGVHFYVEDHKVYCQVYSRSEDVLLGLPYDMAFFSFLNELVAADLCRRLGRTFVVASTSISCTFSQIYTNNKPLVEKLIRRSLVKTIDGRSKSNADQLIYMPNISDAGAVLLDIYRGTAETPVVRWVKDHAKLPR